MAALEAGAVAGARGRVHRFEWEVPEGRGPLYEAGWDDALAASGAEPVRIADQAARQRWSAGPELGTAGSSGVPLQSATEVRALATAVLEWDEDGWVDTGVVGLAVQLLTAGGDSDVDADVRWLAVQRPQGVTAMLLPLVRDIAAGRAQDGAGQLPLTAEEARAALAPLGLDSP